MINFTDVWILLKSCIFGKSRSCTMMLFEIMRHFVEPTGLTWFELDLLINIKLNIIASIDRNIVNFFKMQS